MEWPTQKQTNFFIALQLDGIPQTRQEMGHFITEDINVLSMTGVVALHSSPLILRKCHRSVGMKGNFIRLARKGWGQRRTNMTMLRCSVPLLSYSPACQGEHQTSFPGPVLLTTEAGLISCGGLRTTGLCWLHSFKLW